MPLWLKPKKHQTGKVRSLASEEVTFLWCLWCPWLTYLIGHKVPSSHQKFFSGIQACLDTYKAVFVLSRVLAHDKVVLSQERAVQATMKLWGSVGRMDDLDCLLHPKCCTYIPKCRIQQNPRGDCKPFPTCSVPSGIDYDGSGSLRGLGC